MVEITTIGVRKVENLMKTATTDKHHLGSCGKSMTATLTAKLIEMGYFGWDSSLEDLLPYIQIHDELKKVTFDLLLAHRSSLQSDTENFEKGWLYTALESGIYSPTEARKLMTQKILSVPPKFKPREGFEYSNIGYMIAGYIMEYLTNTSWEVLMNEHIFTPLKMNSCDFGPVSVPGTLFSKQPWGHRYDIGVLQPIHEDNPPACGPAGTIHCTLNDWGIYLGVH